MRLIALGVGDTFTARHHTTALLLEHDGFRLAIDCPDRYRRVLADASATSGLALELPTIDHVLVTHVHGDHMNGVEGVAFWKRFAEHKRLELVCSPEVRGEIWDRRLVAPMGQLWDGQRFHSMRFDEYFAHTELAWSGVTQVGPLSIRAYRTVHHVPTSALLVTAGGRTLGYSADTAFDPGLLAFFEHADLVVHETNHGPAHTPYAALAALPADLRARMRLVHYPDELDLAASVITPLREGDVVDV